MEKDENIHSELSHAYSNLLDSHEKWLASFGESYVKKWERDRHNDIEAVICEAKVKEFLEGKGVEVKPNDISGGPDFLCKKDDKQFYVEVACITIDAAKNWTKLPHPYPEKAGDAIWYRLPTQRILNELSNKTNQCSNLNCPCVVVISTLHCRGRSFFGKKEASFVLTGNPEIMWEIDTERRANMPAKQITHLEGSAFVRCSKNNKGQMEYARNPISAVMLCSFGKHNPSIVGLLHPNPNYSFEPYLLPKVLFGDLTEEHKNGYFSVVWKKYNEDGSWEVIDE